MKYHSTTVITQDGSEHLFEIHDTEDGEFVAIAMGAGHTEEKSFTSFEEAVGHVNAWVFAVHIIHGHIQPEDHSNLDAPSVKAQPTARSGQ